MSDNWIVQNLNSALNTWNEKLSEIWTLLTQSPESFKGGDIWSVITGINGALTAIGYGLLVLFFAAGIVKTCGSFTDMKKPEHALKAFIRFALAQGAIMYGMLGGKPLTLSTLEFRMLNLFCQNRNRVLTRKQLLEKIWDCTENYVDEHTLTTTLSRIRGKIETNGTVYIKTVYGMGYKWTGGEPA